MAFRFKLLTDVVGPLTVAGGKVSAVLTEIDWMGISEWIGAQRRDVREICVLVGWVGGWDAIDS